MDHREQATVVASPFSPANSLRSRCVALAVLAAIICSLISQSPVRRVGDGVEYMAMAYAISTGHSPALSPAEFEVTTHFIDGFSPASGFPGTLVTDVGYQNAAHGQDFAHFWMYSALAAPGVAVARFVGLNANWGFVLLNLLLYFWLP